MAEWIFVYAPLLCQAFVGCVVVYGWNTVVLLEEGVYKALRFATTVLRALGGGRDERRFPAVHVAWLEEDLCERVNVIIYLDWDWQSPL
jgi:hypothetical protein